MWIALLIISGLVGICVLYICSAILYAQMKLRKRPIDMTYQSVVNSDGYTPLSEMPPYVPEYTVRLEDISFYTHKGYSIYSIRQSFKENLAHGRIIAGGSTITQQLAKNLYCSFKQVYFRKLVELFITIRLEKKLTKQQILDLYLNIVYFGNGTWGIKRAADFYFGVSPRNLTENETVFLITLLPAPTKRNPFIHPDIFVNERNESLRLLTLSEIITQQQTDEIKQRFTVNCLDDRLQNREPVILPPPMRNFYINP